MRTRFRLAAWLVIALAVVVIFMKRRAPDMARHSLRPAVAAVPPREPVVARSDAAGPMVTATTSRAARLDVLRRLARQLRELSPQDRDLADELRQAIDAHITDTNAEQIVRDLQETDDSELAQRALARWSAHQPAAAADWLATQAQPSAEQIETVATALAKRETDLNTFFGRAAPSPYRDAMLAATARALVAADAGAAAALAARLPEGSTRAATLHLIADTWIRRDATAARAWIFAQSDQAERAELFNVAAAGLAATDPLDAVEWVLASPLSDSEVSRALRDVSATWARFSPADAQRFVRISGDDSP